MRASSDYGDGERALKTWGRLVDETSTTARQPKIRHLLTERVTRLRPPLRRARGALTLALFATAGHSNALDRVAVEAGVGSYVDVISSWTVSPRSSKSLGDG
jgi:hypothetical protein